MRSSRPSLDALESEIRETRRRLGALMARAERELPMRSGLQLLRRFGGAAEHPGWWGLAAAAAAFAIGLVAAQRLGREPTPPEPGGPSTES